MIDFSLKRINEQAPYEVWQYGTDFRFCTNAGLHYTISFKEDMPIGGCETYQFIINKVEDAHSPHDSLVRATVISIINEFFVSNLNVLLYICDTSDGREAMRNRLFVSWFEEFSETGRFTIRNANAEVEGEGIYAAIIVENRNERLKYIIDEFDETARVLARK